jgi:hypothetical protein
MVEQRHAVAAWSAGVSGVAATFAGILASRATTGLSHNAWFIACLVCALAAFAVLLAAGAPDLAGWLRGPTGNPRATLAVRLAPRPRPLAGREELLAEMDSLLSPTGRPDLRVVALCGLGGVGKTSLAVEYFYRHKDDLPVVWTFAAENRESLRDGFSELAVQLSDPDVGGPGDPVAKVHRMLADRSADWLLVFDNAPYPTAIQDMLPPLGCGRVVITSQNPNWPTCQTIDVPVLDQQTAAEFLMKRIGSADRDAAWELAGELGGLPLALEQAADFVKAAGESIAGYLALFRERRPDRPAGTELAQQTVTTTWALAFERLQHGGPGPIALLRLLACCAPDAIPLDLLFQDGRHTRDASGLKVGSELMPLLEDRVKRASAVVALRRYSLINEPQDGPASVGRLVSVHRMVQVATLSRLSADLVTAWRQAAAFLIGAAFPVDSQQPATWPVCAALLPHARVALPIGSDGMEEAASYLGWLGDYTAARDLQRQVIQAKEDELGSSHPGVLIARADLARWTGDAGDPAGARDELAALVPVMKNVLGAENPSTLITRDRLARWTGDAGDAVGARDQLTELLPATKRVLGAENTSGVRTNLARFTGEAGDPAEARDQFAELVQELTDALGAKHYATMMARGHLARFTGEAGDPAWARDQFAELLPVRVKELGARHPDTLDARASLARWTGEAGDAAGARQQFAALLPELEQISGTEHPDTLDARTRLAHWTHAEAALPSTDEQPAPTPRKKRGKNPAP